MMTEIQRTKMQDGGSGRVLITHNYYTPGVYEIAEDRVTPFAIDGSLEVISIQESDPDRKYIFFQPGLAKWHTDRAQVSEALAAQLSGEIARQGGQVVSPADRTMKIAVPRVSLTPATWVSVADLFVQVSLDGGPLRQFQVKNKSPGNIWRVMNGGIAIAVIEILNDPDVRSWLAQSTSQPEAKR